MTRVNNTVLALMAKVQTARERNEEGQGLVEYGLIIALVGLACVIALGVLAGGIQGLLGDAAAALNVA